MIFAVLFLLFGSILSTVHAEELEEIEATETELFASAQDLSVEEVCELLETDESIQQVSAFNNDVYYIDNHTLYRYDTTSDTLAVAYAGEIEVNYYVPGENGILLGTIAPTDAMNQAYTDPVSTTGLSWTGEYYFVDSTTRRVSSIDDPGWTFLVMTTNTISDLTSFSTTINGKAIPSSTYPIGSYYTGSDNGGSQCHGFGYAIIKYLYGDYDNVTTHTIEDTLSASQIKTYNLGSMIRAYTADYKHTMILVGYDSGGIYVYHANWEEVAGNRVSISYVENAAFESNGTFPSIEYIKEHNHSYSTISTYSTDRHKKTCVCGTYTTVAHTFSSWTNYNSTQHSRTCTGCGYTAYGSHNVSTWSYYSSLNHKGTCSICAGTVYQAHTNDSSGRCTKCVTYVNRTNPTITFII